MENNIERPNIIVILADDMGFSDLGCTGAEIATPNLDNMAENGILFTNFYNSSRCCPSRASLLTGLYQHRAGVGHMVGNLGYLEYQGFLRKDCLTIAEALQHTGYNTIMTGKWHVGDAPEHWPNQRGFQDFYGIPAGGGLYFYPSKFLDRPIYKNEKQIFPDEKNFYSTDAFTSEAIEFIKKSVEEDKPFFAYIAHIAPHYPLQALPQDIQKYKGKYDEGYEAIRNKRFEKQVKMGLFDRETKLSDASFPPWETMNDQHIEARKMEVYAAQVDRLDQNIGVLVNALKKLKILDNTIICFLSDNGACAEEVNRSPGEELGTANSFVAYGEQWAKVSNTPYRLYKSRAHEGGIITPMIIQWPKGIAKTGHIDRTPVHIIDIMPTFLELAGTDISKIIDGNDLLMPDGSSFADLLSGKPLKRPENYYWEHQGNQAIRVNDLKLVKKHAEDWELYDLKNDPTELNDLVNQRPSQKDSLEILWSNWASEYGVRNWPVKKNIVPQ
ncbi:MAG: arylsulfatase [Cyclobacteriaceae bacterium]|nr:arylsulfatase [Cyclobacteriaceae bacterium]